MRRRKVKNVGICPYCNLEMNYENGENGENVEFYWECKCGRNFNEYGKDITDYSCTNIRE